MTSGDPRLEIPLQSWGYRKWVLFKDEKMWSESIIFEIKILARSRLKIRARSTGL